MSIIFKGNLASLLIKRLYRNPFAVHFSSIKVSDLVLVSPEGYVTEHGAQLPINMAGFHIHSAIHKVRLLLSRFHNSDAEAMLGFHRLVQRFRLQRTAIRFMGSHGRSLESLSTS